MEAILTNVDQKVSKLKTSIKPSESNPILKQIDVISCLETLQKSLLLFLLIKHSTVWLLFVNGYVKVILKEISVIGLENNTHCKANKSYDELIDENSRIYQTFGF